MLTVSRTCLAASLCRESFFDFVKEFWDTIVAEKPVWNWHIPFLCDELQRMCERVYKRQPKEYDLIVNVSPGSTKSIVNSIMLPPWAFTRDPYFRMICGSYAHPLSLYLAGLSRRVIESDKYRRYYPEIVLAKTGEGLFGTRQGGWRYSTSTGGSVTGMHAHFISIDDPINPKDAVSDVTLAAANQWLDHTLMSRMVDKNITPWVLTQQRLHQNDPTGHQLLKQRNNPEEARIRHVCLPAEITDRVRPRSCRQFYKNGLFDPIRLPKKTLDKVHFSEMGEYAYAGQYLQSPVPMAGGMFRTDQIVIVDAAPPPMRQIVRYWDKAGTGGKGCWTVGMKMGIDKDRSFWLLDVVRGQWESSERERVIKQTAVMDGKGVLIGVEQEPGSGGKESAQNTLKNLAGWRIRLDKPVGDKQMRADTFAVQVNCGNVRMVKAPWNQTLIDELRFFPASTFKDQADASSGAFAILSGKRLVVGGFN